ncbi:MAG: DUF4262 domain-containing protein [Burkholderiaceae bacterium]
MSAPAPNELTPDDIARIRRDINHVIETQGWITLSAYPSETLPAFTCTAGLGRKSLPELLVFGLFPEEARATIKRFARLVLSGQCPPLGARLSGILDGADAMLVEVPHDSAAPYMEVALEFSPKGFRVLQLLWTKPLEPFPGEAGYSDEQGSSQPLISPAVRV